MIPNLLSSGKFPPPPHSPRQHNRSYPARGMSMSPPTIVSSVNYNALSSPPIPAAPPSTPYTPYNNVVNAAAAAAGAAAGSGILPLPLAADYDYTLNHRPSSPPLMASNTNNSITPSSPFAATSQSSANDNIPSILSSANNIITQRAQSPNIPPLISPGSPSPLTSNNDSHYNTLLNQSLHETMEREKSRITSLTQHESQNYTTITEYQHALSRERRHSTSLAMELAQYKFLTRYTSCNIHSAAEINEEARVNTLIKNIDNLKRGMNEDRCRVVMELEREKERIINGLVMRLEGEKMLLERQIGSVRGGSGGGIGSGGIGNITMSMDADEQRLHAQFERMMADSSAAAAASAPAAAGQQLHQERLGVGGAAATAGHQILAATEDAGEATTSDTIGATPPRSKSNNNRISMGAAVAISTHATINRGGR